MMSQIVARLHLHRLRTALACRVVHSLCWHEEFCFCTGLQVTRSVAALLLESGAIERQ